MKHEIIKIADVKNMLIITASLHIIRMCQLAFKRNTIGNSGASPPLSATCIFSVLRYCECDLYILGASLPLSATCNSEGRLYNRPSFYK